MTFIEALLSGKAFRRKGWDLFEEDKFSWVVVSSDGKCLDWANPDGTPSGNVYGCVSVENQIRDDWEVLKIAESFLFVSPQQRRWDRVCAEKTLAPEPEFPEKEFLDFIESAAARDSEGDYRLKTIAKWAWDRRGKAGK